VLIFCFKQKFVFKCYVKGHTVLIKNYFASGIPGLRITVSLKKYNYALSKLPLLLIKPIGPLCRHPSSYCDPYQELQDILLRSYGLGAAQRTGKWLDYPGCISNRPSVMWDNLTALQPSTVKEIQTVLFLRKLPCHIRNLINLPEFKEPEDLIQRCNEIWEDKGSEEAATAAAAITRPHSPFRDTRHSSSPFCGKGLASDRSGRHRSWPAQRRLQRPHVFLPPPLQKQGQEVEEISRKAAHIRKTNRRAPTLPPPPALFIPAASPPFTLCGNQPLPCLSYLQKTNIFC
jgi:hypothetical protein